MLKNDNPGFIAEKAFKEAVVKALDFHARMGVPAVFVENGVMLYRLPDGTTVEKLPKKYQIKKTK